MKKPQTTTAKADAGKGAPADGLAADAQAKNTSPTENAGGTGNAAGPVAKSAPVEAMPQDEAEARKLYPLSCAALDRVTAALPDDFKGGIIARITTRQQGFRRAGIAHVGTADHKVADFTLAQLETLLSEPVLTVEIVGVE